MLCSICKQREATNELVIRENNTIKKFNLCNECMMEHYLKKNMFLGGIIDPMFSSLADVVKAPTRERGMICPECGTTSEEFADTLFVGCPKCYETFEPLVNNTLKRLQGSTAHVGKNPKGAKKGETAEEVYAKIKESMEKNDIDEVDRLLKVYRSLTESNDSSKK